MGLDIPFLKLLGNKFWWLVVAILIIGYGFRIYNLGYPSIGVDEGVTYYFSDRSLGSLLSIMITDDIHPPLYYITVHYWIAMVGSSEFAMRYLSLAYGMLLISMIGAFGKRLFDCRVGLVAALFASLSPIYVTQSQEIRMYMSLTFWCLVAAYSLYRALNSGQIRWWGVYALSALASIYTHYYALFVLMALSAFFFLFWFSHRRAILPWLGAHLLVAIGFAPWATYAIGQMLRVTDFWPGTLSFITMVKGSFLAFSFGEQKGSLWIGIAAAALAAFMILGFVSIVRNRSNAKPFLFLLLYLLIPIIITYAITASRPKFGVRYLLLITPAMYLLLAFGLTLFYRRLTLLFVLGLAAFVVAFSYSSINALASQPMREDYRSAVDYILKNSQPGDAVGFIMNRYQPFEYYSHGRLPRYGMPNGPVAEQLNTIAEKQGRLWLLLSNEGFVDPKGTIPYLLAKFGKEIPIDASFQKLGLRLYNLRPKPDFKESPQPDNPLDLEFANGMKLLGYDVGSNTLTSGASARFTFYWQAGNKIDEDLYVYAELLDERGVSVSEAGMIPVTEYYQPRKWLPGETLPQLFEMPVPLGTPPGRYSLRIWLYSVDESRTIPFAAKDGAWRDSYHLSDLTVRKAPLPYSVAKLPIPQNEPPQRVATLNFLGSDLEASSKVATNGETLALTLFWQAAERPNLDYQMSLYLEAGQRKWGLRDFQSLLSAYPTHLWEKGEIVRDPHHLLIPSDAPPGKAKVAVIVREGQTGRTIGEVVVGSIIVKGRAREFEIPSLKNPLQVTFAREAKLLGSDVPRKAKATPGHVLSLNLYWQALAQIGKSYLVVLHLYDSNEKVVWEEDGLPQNNSYPTNGWLPGEVIADRHRLAIPKNLTPGRYSLTAALLDAEEGTLLSATDGQGKDIWPDTEIAALYIKDTSLVGTANPQIGYRHQVPLGGIIALEGHDLDKAELRRGESLSITLYWKALAPITEDYTVFLHLVDEQGNKIAQRDRQPLDGNYPTSIWEKGEYIKDAGYTLTIPADIQPGEYWLLAGLYRLQTNGRLKTAEGTDHVVLGKVRVRV